jgi:hypothetical protein
MKRRRIKQEVFRILEGDDMHAIETALAAYQPVDVVNHLFSALCSTSEKVRWHAVTMFGKVVPAIAASDLEAARIIMRRFLWTLNDESGGIGWGSPEAMAEIMAANEQLAEEYVHMLISYMREDGPELFQDGNYLELPMLQRGLLWGIGRLCQSRRELMREKKVVPDLLAYLDSEDKVVQGLAIWCLTLLQDSSAGSEVEACRVDYSEVPVYLDCSLQLFTLAELAGTYISQANEVKASVFR